MPYQKIAIFVGAIIVIVVALLGVAYFAHLSPFAAEEPGVTHGPGYTIEQEAILEGVPDLTRPIAFSDSIPAQIRAIIEDKAKVDIGILEDDKTNAGAWLDLALQYKMANDFESSRLIWEFMIKVAPKDTTSYNNLGRMYHFDLKEFAKSEEYLKKSMEIDPKSAAPYLELYQLYNYSYKTNTTAAVDILKQGAVAFPKDPGFPYTLGGYYRDHGRSVEARASYNQALTIARAANDLELVSAINADLANLP